MTTVNQLVSQLLGVEPVRVERTGSPDAWYADLPGDRRVVVKRPGWLNRPGSPRVEAWIYGECRRHGTRVPEVLALSEDPECPIIERFPGQSLTAERHAVPLAAARAAWARVGEDLRVLHQIRLPGFGPLVPGPDRPHGEASEWCPFADRACAEGIPWLVDAGFLEPAGADKLMLARIHRLWRLEARSDRGSAQSRGEGAFLGTDPRRGLRSGSHDSVPVGADSLAWNEKPWRVAWSAIYLWCSAPGAKAHGYFSVKETP
jgi:hypothetical protein